MQTNSEKIIQVIKKIIPLLELADNSDADYYKRFLQYILGELNKPHQPDLIAENILRAYGGMATFSDVGLWKDGKVLKEEDDELEELCEELFILCKTIIVESRQHL